MPSLAATTSYIHLATSNIVKSSVTDHEIGLSNTEASCVLDRERRSTNDDRNIECEGVIRVFDVVKWLLDEDHTDERIDCPEQDDTLTDRAYDDQKQSVKEG